MRSVLVGMVTLALALLGGAAAAEEAVLPKPIVDAPDLRIHQVPTVCNTYVLVCKKTKRFVIVDPGLRIEALLAAASEGGHTLEAVWITHEHRDHCVGLKPLLAARSVPTVQHPAIKEGHVVKVGNLAWDVLHLPGHSPGSLGFVLPQRVLVAGDVLFQGSVGRTDLSTSDERVFQTSLGKVWSLDDGVRVLPGHGATTTIGAEKKTNWLFQDLVRAGRGEPPLPRPWIGIAVDPSYSGSGVRVGEVTEGSPGARAGLKRGDVIQEADGTRLAGSEGLGLVVRRHAVGDTVRLRVRRGDDTLDLLLTFGARPPR